MSVDKNFCMNSYLALRYIVDPEMDFYTGMRHLVPTPIPASEKIPVSTAQDIHIALERQITALKNRKLGVLLSGGIDSAVIASYLSGCDAYTFRYPNNFQMEEWKRAEIYSKRYGLRLHYVDINWDTVIRSIDTVMRSKGAPVHSIEPQIYTAAIQAKADGVETVLIGDDSDYIFGGMDQILSKDWLYDEFINWFLYLDTREVLKSPISMAPFFEPYRKGDKIDFLRVLHGIVLEESHSSYENAFNAAQMDWFDGYARLEMALPLDLYRIRHGEPKYLIRELFSMRYPDLPIPHKIPMPRPVDFYFQNWQGPSRPEFRRDMLLERYSGNQKWLLWCLEHFLNTMEPLQL